MPKRIVHRDLKPENILLQSSSDDESIKLADFGIAAEICLAASQNEQAHALKRLCGSPEYMAPEIIEHVAPKMPGYGSQCDVWSLGVIMYILLSGEPHSSLMTRVRMRACQILGTFRLFDRILKSGFIKEGELCVDPGENAILDAQ